MWGKVYLKPFIRLRIKLLGPFDSTKVYENLL